MKQLETVILSFPGFYNSGLDDYMDQEVETEMGEQGEDYETVEKRTEYSRGRLAIASAWLDEFNKETNLNLKFKEINSPKEYNFSTDKLVCEISEEEFNMIRAKVLEDNEDRGGALQDTINNHFTQRDGFYPFYSNDIEEWLVEKENWDHNEIGTWIEAYFLLMDFDADFADDNSRIREVAQAIWTS